MGKRLMTWRQIRDEKLAWCRSKGAAKVKAGVFPAPLICGGPGPNLWEETAVDTFVDEYIAKAKEAAAKGEQGANVRSAKATAARAQKRAAQEVAKRKDAAEEVERLRRAGDEKSAAAKELLAS